jgi:(p)ppGpp synthase/HD superfamily hydrolase
MLTERFDIALGYASKAHREQVRKGSGVPYIAHLLGVASIALEYGADEDQAIAALLHDAVEDQGGLERLEDIRNRFGERVAGIVADCTDSHVIPKPPWRERKEQYIASLDGKPAASLLVSLADKTHNAEAIVADLERSGDEVWMRFTGKRDGTIWYYETLVVTFARLVPGKEGRFAKAVSAMKTH